MSLAKTDLGAVTNYAYAVEHGYFEGTEEEYNLMMAQTAQNAQICSTSAESASADAETATIKAAEAVAAAATASAAYGTDIVGDNFSAEKNYSAGDYVIYDGDLYRFTADHPAGAWEDENPDAVVVAIANDVVDLKSDINIVTGVGVNLFDASDYDFLKAYINTSNNVITSNVNAITVYVPCEPNTTYTVSKIISQRFVLGCTAVEPVTSAVCDVTNGTKTTIETRESITITTGSTSHWLLAFVYLSTADTYTLNDILSSLMIQTGDSATAYYKHLTAKDDLARLELGGKLDNPKNAPNNKNLLSYVSGGTAWVENPNGAIELNEQIAYNALGFIQYNAVDIAKNTDGKRLNLEDGTLLNNSAYTTTDFIKVVPNGKYKLSGTSTSDFYCYYDKDKNFLSGFRTDGENIGLSSIQIPDNVNGVRICYVRHSVLIAKKDSLSWMLYSKCESVYTVTPEEGLLVGLRNARRRGVNTVKVSAGNYDIIDEYESYFGADYFTNYATNYNNRVNGIDDCGIYLENMTVVFSKGANVIAHYDGDNSEVTSYFSAFSCGDNVTIDGLILDCLNLRYAIHPDFWFLNDDVSHLTIKNCDLRNYRENDNTANSVSAIGAGFPPHGTWLIENCIFRSDEAKRVVRIHNNTDPNAQSFLTIKNCIILGDGHIEVNYHGTSTAISEAIISGCAWKNPPITRAEGSSTVVNVQIHAFANEVLT